MEDIVSQKKSLRKEIAKKLSLLSEQEKKAQSNECVSQIEADSFFAGCDVVLSYSAMKNEVNLSCLAEKIFSSKKKLALPRMIPGTSLMDFYYVDEGEFYTGLAEGRWGIKEPPLNEEKKVTLANLFGKKVLVLVPGVAFTKKGNRLGHGKGFYDIYFSSLLRERRLEIKLCGVCFSCQIKDSFPCEAHDLLMNYVFYPLAF